MKKIMFFICAVAIAVGCSDDNNNQVSSVDESLIIGKWEIQQILVNDEEQELSDCWTGTYSEFKSDGTLHEYFICSGTAYEDISTYTISDNVLTTTFTDSTINETTVTDVNILTLSEDALVLQHSYTEDSVSYTIKTTYFRM